MTDDLSAARSSWMRPRTFVLLAILAFVVLVGWVVLETLRVARADPAPSATFRQQMIDHGASAFDDAYRDSGPDQYARLLEIIDAAAVILDGIEADLGDGTLATRESAYGHVDFDYIRSGSAVPSDIEVEREALRRLTPVFDDLDGWVADGPGYFVWPVSNQSVLATLLPELGAVRGLIKARVASMRIAAAAGDADELVRAVAQSLALAQTIAAQSTLIHHLVGSACQALVLDEIGQIAQEPHDLPASAWRQIGDLIARYETVPIEHALEGERLAFHDTTSHMFTARGYMSPKGIGGFGLSAGSVMGAGGNDTSFIMAFNARFLLATRGETLAIVDEYIGEARREAKLPPTRRWQTFDPDLYLTRLPHRYRMATLLLPALKRAVETGDLARLQAAGTQIMVAIAAYHAERGGWPTTLDALVPEFLDALPPDPMTGQSFVLKRDDVPADRPYVLYSVGFDGTDDGGNIDEQDPARALREGSSGFDYALGEPRSDWQE